MHLALAYLGRESVPLEYLSAAAKRAGHRVSFAYDPGAFSDNDNVYHNAWLERRFARIDLLEQKLRRDPPDAILFFVYSNTFQWGLELARRVRRDRPVPTIFAGLHATMAPAAVLREPEVDYVIVGEGEETLPELLDCLAASQSPAEVRGIQYREDGEARATPMRPPLDLETLPLPDKELFADEFNMADDYVILCGRGCPCSCTYCREGTIRRLYGKGYFRRRRIDSIIHELETMRARHGFGRVMIDDPILFTPKAWTLELLDAYRSRVNLPFRCYGQVGHFDEEIGRALLDAGCYGLEFGLQTANEEIRLNILGRDDSDEQMRRALEICDRIGLRYDLDHMFGLPGETEQDFIDAARLYADARRLNRVKVHMLAYFPGAPIVQTAERMGVIGPEVSAAIERGEVGDICREPGANDEQTRRFMREWKTFYKVMPLLGRRLGRAFIDRGWHRWFGRLPFPVEILLQLLVALRGRDQRFVVYIKYLWFRLRRHRQVRREARAMGWS
ncbi:MAG: radical SAM protein [Candidatus Lernaella stagnicola]|nr:radical SAM protein [Candidatus Lernaella stagnicola]